MSDKKKTVVSTAAAALAKAFTIKKTGKKAVAK